MFSFLYSAGNKIKETFQGYGYLDSNDEIEKFKAKNLPGLELQLASDFLQKYKNYISKSSISIRNSYETGIMYNLKYGGLGARVFWKPSPMTQFTATLRRLGDVYGLASMAVLDFDRYKLVKWDVGVNLFAGNMSYQINLDTDKLVLSTRQGIYPRLLALSEANIVFKDSALMSSLVLGFEWQIQPRSTFQVMFSHHSSPTFALQYQCSSIQCLVKVYGDIFYNRSSIYRNVFDNKIGVSLSFHPFPFFHK